MFSIVKEKREWCAAVNSTVAAGQQHPRDETQNLFD